MFKYYVLMLLCCSMGLVYAGNTLGCLRAAAEQQIENGNAEKLAAILLTQGLNKLDKDHDIDKQVEKFGALTGLKAEANEHGVTISSPTSGVTVSYTPNSDRAQVLTALLGDVVAAHAAS